MLARDGFELLRILLGSVRADKLDDTCVDAEVVGIGVDSLGPKLLGLLESFVELFIVLGHDPRLLNRWLIFGLGSAVNGML
jgi:hypothetical protein